MPGCGSELRSASSWALEVNRRRGGGREGTRGGEKGGWGGDRGRRGEGSAPPWQTMSATQPAGVSSASSAVLGVGASASRGRRAPGRRRGRGGRGPTPDPAVGDPQPTFPRRSAFPRPSLRAHSRGRGVLAPEGLAARSSALPPPWEGGASSRVRAPPERGGGGGEREGEGEVCSAGLPRSSLHVRGAACSTVACDRP